MKKKNIFTIPHILIFSFVFVISSLLLVLVVLKTTEEKSETEPEVLGVNVSQQKSELDSLRDAVNFSTYSSAELEAQIAELVDLRGE